MFSDAGQIASWSKGSVAAAVNAGILKGYPNGTFAPVQALTRAESLSLIDASSALKAGGAAEETPQSAATPAASTAPAPSPTATTAAVGGGGTGGGGGGTGGGSAADPAPAATPTPAATPAPLAIPFVDGVRIGVNEEIFMANSVNLNIDLTLVPDETAAQFDHFNQYLTNGSIPVEQLLSGDFRYEPFGFTSRVLNYPIYEFELEGITDPYITQVFYNANNQPVGYYKQKIDGKLIRSTKSAQFAEITEGVTASKVSVGEDVYYVQFDVTEVFGQPGNQAYYYSVNTYETDTTDNPAYIDQVLTSQDYLYSQDDQRSVYLEFGLERTYYIVFYDRNLQAVSYYAGDWAGIGQKAVDSAISRIHSLPDVSALTLADEDAVAGALRKFDALSDEQKLNVSIEDQEKLHAAVAAIGSLRPLGSLGYPYFNNILPADDKYFLNSSTFKIDAQNMPGLLRYTSDKFSYSTSNRPLDPSQLKELDNEYKYNLNDAVNVFYLQSQPDEYLNVILYDKQGDITAYYSEPLNLPVVKAVWESPILQITDGIDIRKSETENSVEIDVSKFLKQNSQQAAYYTVASQFTGELYEVKPETWLNFNNVSYLYSTKYFTEIEYSYLPDQQYLIIFYDNNLKVLGYYQGKATYTEQQLLDQARILLSLLPAADAITLDDEYNLEKARHAYDALTDSQRQQLDASYLAKLEQAEAALQTLHFSGPLTSILRIGGVTRNLEFPMLNGTHLDVNFRYLPESVANLAKSFKAYYSEQPFTQDNLKNQVPNATYPIFKTSVLERYNIPGPALPGELYVTLVFYDQSNAPIAYNTEKVEFTIKRPILDGTASGLTEGVQITSKYVGEINNITLDVSEILNNEQLGVSYYTVTSKRELGGEAGFTVENAALQRNFLQTNDTSTVGSYGEEEFLILFYDSSYKVLYYYKTKNPLNVEFAPGVTDSGNVSIPGANDEE
ncbi:S-layer homology domain-containing protein [Paenibacillus sp. PK3_47]|uniref:S-layer homology domain-containing protein n=1 Tax=Paenibacillus sp. PK3_47 TaxID=2072642 RepID=UPI00201D5770|nr:S-layer homology domain-containing protein [Paenibacillus sp. PK3_47]